MKLPFLQTLSKYMTAKRMPIIMGIACVIVLAGGLSYHYAFRTVRVDIYGSSIDPNTLAVIESVAIAQTYMPNHFDIRIHPVLKPTEKGAESYMTNPNTPTKTQTQQPSVEEETNESLRLRALQDIGAPVLLKYLETRYRTPLPDNDIFTILNINPTLISVLMKQEQKNMDADNTVFANLIKKNNLVQYQVPQVFLNGELYSGSGSPHVIASRVARILLRGDVSELPTPRHVSLLGGRIEFTMTRPYTIHHIPEAYSAADCQDHTDKSGILTDAGTAYARCTYHDPVPLKLSVIGATTPETTQLLDGLTKDFKGLSVLSVTAPAELTRAQKAIRDLELPDTFKALAKEPYLIIEGKIMDDPAGEAYYQSGLLIPLSDGRYLFNSIPFKKTP